MKLKYEYFIHKNLVLKLEPNSKIKNKIITSIKKYQVVISFDKKYSFNKIKKLITNNLYLQKKIIQTIQKNPLIINEKLIFIFGNPYQVYFFLNKKRKFDFSNSLKIWGDLNKYNQFELINWWVKKYSFQYFKAVFDELINESFPEYKNIKIKIKIFEAKSIWGSCKKDLNNIVIFLNTKLIHMPKKYLYYVIYHEISHIKYQNHSKNFWHLVDKKMENYLIYKKTINSYKFI